MDGISIFKEFGLLGLVIGSVIILLFFVIKWTLATTKDILNQAAVEREAFRKCIAEHTEQAKIFHEQVNEAHKYQREEHSRMIKSLDEINSSLVRINGYKHDGKRERLE